MAKSASKTITLRPILYIGLGGFGCDTIRSVKREIQREMPDDIGGFGFIGLDTHQRSQGDTLALDEYIPLSIGVRPENVVKQRSEQMAWYRQLAQYYTAASIQGGANKVKAVGRFAFRNPPVLQDYLDKLEGALGRLTEFRKRFNTKEPVKVYVISTLAGGTGAGCLLDVLMTTGYICSQQNADFPYQAIIATPDVLDGEAPAMHFPDFYANTYATLKEIHHFFVSGQPVIIDYGIRQFGQVELSADFMPRMVHLIGDKNEEGTTVATRIQELSNIAASYLLSEVLTPLDTTGQPRVQDAENVSFDDAGLDGMPRAFSSFGVVRVGLPHDTVRDLFAVRLMHATLEQELHIPGGMFDAAHDWLGAHRLREDGADQLQDLLRSEVGTDRLAIDTDLLGRLKERGYKRKTVVSLCEQLREELESSANMTIKPQIEAAALRVRESTVRAIEEEFAKLLTDKTLGEALAFIDELAAGLRRHQTALSEESNASQQAYDEAAAEVARSLEEIREATEAFIVGRGARIEAAVSDYEGRVEALLAQQIDLWVKEQASGVYTALLNRCRRLRDDYEPVARTLAAYQGQAQSEIFEIERRLNEMADIGKRGPGNRFSLVDAERVNQIYEESMKPREGDLTQQIHRRWIEHQYFSAQAATASWFAAALEQIASLDDLNRELARLDFLTIMKRFYSADGDLRELFNYLTSLSSPLFTLNPDRCETNYTSFWIVGVHSDLKNEFINRYDKQLTGKGKSFAVFDSRNEVILYQLKLGYTVHSHRSIAQYERSYQQAQKNYRQSFAERKRARPVHGWPEAHDWEELIPNQSAEESAVWFVLGRAFSHLYPTPGAKSPKDRKNAAYLYARGNNYYLQFDESKPEVLVGKGLAEAFQSLAEHPEWRQALQQRIRQKQTEVGVQTILERIENEYLPLLTEEIESSNARPEQQERAAILRKLLVALRKYIRDELQTPTI